MQASVALNLAADIIEDHFGRAVRIVADVLLIRGQLSIQEIVRFTKEECNAIQQQPLKFQHIRNSLLLLLQHGLLVARPHPTASQSGDEVQQMKQVYGIPIEEVFARIRFSKYIEHICDQFGDIPAEMLCTVLKYGTASAEFIVEECRKALAGVTDAQLHGEFQRLINENVVRVIEPFQGVPTDPADSSRQNRPSQGATAPIRDADSDSQSEGEQPGGQKATVQTPSKLDRPAVPSKPVRPANLPVYVYRYNRRVLDLSLVKGLICRLVEERINQHAGQVVATLLSAVRPTSQLGGTGVDVDWLKFPQIAQRMKELGFCAQGRDPEREKEKLRKVLTLLAAHKDALLRQRTVTSAGSASAGGSGRPTKSRRGSAQSAAVGDEAEPEEETNEWCIEWPRAKKILINATTTQLIRDQFGTAGLRIFNLLSEGNPPQRLEDSHIFNICMIPPTEGREILHAMITRGILTWQEISRGANSPLVASYWLHYVDRRRLEASLTWNVLQAILNLRVRFRVEMERGQLLESRQDSLTKKELQALNAGRRVEDILERSFLVLDAALMIFRQQ